MGDWKEVTLKEISSKIGSGATPRGGSNSYKDFGISLIRSQNVLDFKFSISGLAFIDEEQANGLNNVIVEENDILLNITGDSVARCCIVPKKVIPARVNQHVAIIRLNPDKTNFKFIFYKLQYLKEELLMQSEVGATRRALTKGIVEDLIILLPPLPEQKAIAGVLSSLDDKIDLLHRQNKTLEALAETLFRQWFVEEAEEDWGMIELGDVVETTSGGTPSREKMYYFENGVFHWVKSKELNGGFIIQTEEKITEDALKSSSAKLLPPNSILIAMYGATVGEYAIIAEEMTCNQAMCALKSNKKYPFTFLFMIIKQMKNEFKTMAVGSAQQNISQMLIKKILLPTCTERIERYHFVVEPLFHKIKSNIYQIRTLEKLRDTLLPKLMSGEVRIKMSK